MTCVLDPRSLQVGLEVSGLKHKFVFNFSYFVRGADKGRS